MIMSGSLLKPRTANSLKESAVDFKVQNIMVIVGFYELRLQISMIAK